MLISILVIILFIYGEAGKKYLLALIFFNLTKNANLIVFPYLNIHMVMMLSANFFL